MGLTKKQYTMICVFLAGALLAVLNQTLLSPALPVIMTDMQIDATTVQWLTSGYSLVEAIIIPLSAYLLGRFSTRKLFIIGISLFAIGSFLAAIAPVFGVILLGRMFQAAATGIVMPMTFTVILLIFPREKRGQAMGIVGLVIGFAPAIGPSLSGVLVDSVGWRALFIIVTILAVIVVVLGALALENFGNFEKTSFDKPSVVLCSLGLLSLLYGLSSITSTNNIILCGALIGLGLVLLAFFVHRQFKLDVPLLRIQVLKTRNFAITVTLVATMQGALIGTGVLLPIFIQSVRGFSALETGLVMLPGAVIGALVGYFAGRLFDRFGARKIIIPGSAVAFLGSFGLVLFGMDSTLVFICVVYTVLAIGLQFVVTPLNTWGINSLDNRVIQHANAVSNTLLQVGGSLGTAILVSLSAMSTTLYPEASPLEQMFLGDHLSFSVTASIMFLVFAAICFFVRDRKTGASKAAEGELEAMPAQIKPSIAVERVMNAKPYFVSETDTIRSVAQIMARYKTSGLPVVDTNKQVVGYISDGDIMKYIGRNDQTILDSTMMLYQINEQESYAQRVAALIDLNVMRIATKRVIAVDSSTPVEDVCQIFAKRRIKKVPVVKDNKLVGSISRADIIRSTMANLALIEEVATKENGASDKRPEILA